jgi:ankyrin repeat protein
LLLAYGADPNVVEPEYGPVINLCFEYGHIPLLRYLVEHAGANIELVNEKGESPLMIAGVCGEGVTELCELGADVHRTDLLGNTAIHHTITDHENCLPLITSLIEHGADISKGNNEGNTPLHRAAVELRGQCDDVLRLLLDLGADVFARNNEGLMPIDLIEKDSSVRTVLEERMRDLTDLRFKRIPEADLQRAVVPTGAAADGAVEEEEDEEDESSSEDEDEDE